MEVLLGDVVLTLLTEEEGTTERTKVINSPRMKKMDEYYPTINSPSSGVCTVRLVQGPAPTLVLARTDIR